MWTYDDVNGYWVNSDTGDISLTDPTASSLPVTDPNNPAYWGPDVSGQATGPYTNASIGLTASQQMALVAAGKPLSTTDPSFLNTVASVGGQVIRYVAQRQANGQTLYVAQAQRSNMMIWLLAGAAAFLLMKRKEHANS